MSKILSVRLRAFLEPAMVVAEILGLWKDQTSTQIIQCPGVQASANHIQTSGAGGEWALACGTPTLGTWTLILVQAPCCFNVVKQTLCANDKNIGKLRMSWAALNSHVVRAIVSTK